MIKTEYVNPTIPDRDHDWLARFDWQDEECPLHGNGETENDAVLNLLMNIGEDTQDDGSAQEEIVEMAFSHWQRGDRMAALLRKWADTEGPGNSIALWAERDELLREIEG